MKISLYLVFISFLLPLKSISQITTGEIPVLLETEKAVYTSGDTIKLSFSFDTLEVVYSNFGGCGDGPLFMVRNIKKNESGDIYPTYCDYLLEHTFFTQGTFEIVIRNSGIYTIVLYTKNLQEDLIISNEWNPIRSNEFEVVSFD